MFGTNQIAGKRHFNAAPADTLLVTSIFYTLQGEGPFAGMPAVFIRLAKCNLACSFCDTYFDTGDWLSFHVIGQRIRAAIGAVALSKDLVLVITGGEPGLQSNLFGFLLTQIDRWKHIQIESNGTYPMLKPESVFMVVSPKCKERDGKPTEYLERNHMALGHADCLKFLIDADPDSPYHEIPEWAFEWQLATGREIYCSPMNRYARLPALSAAIKSVSDEALALPDMTLRNAAEVISFWEPGLLDMQANRANHEYAARYCLEHGLRLTLQMHLYASLA